MLNVKKSKSWTTEEVHKQDVINRYKFSDVMSVGMSTIL